MSCFGSCTKKEKNIAFDFFGINVEEYKDLIPIAHDYALRIKDLDFEIGTILYGYPLFFLNASGQMLADLLNEKGMFSEVKSDSFMWCLVTDTHTKIYFINENNAWRVYKASQVYVDNSISFGVINIDLSYEKIKNSKKIGMVESTFFAEDIGTGTNYVVLETNNGEFVIPYFNNPSISSFIDGEIYTSKEMIDEMKFRYN